MRFKWDIRKKKKKLGECLVNIRSPVVPPDASQVYGVVFQLVPELFYNMLIIELILNY